MSTQGHEPHPQPLAEGAARVVQVGVGGYGRWHLERLARLREEGRAQLVGVVDPHVAAKDVDVPVFGDLAAALSQGGVDVVSIAAPTGLHAELAEQSLRAGADVYLEKPPAASLEAFHQLVDVCESAPGSVQIGFQALGSEGLARMRRVMAEQELGRCRRVVATGTWSRSVAYYARSPWAGHRFLDGVAVADGAVANPLSHAVAMALAVAGAATVADVAWVETELYRAHDIETDDTSWVRVRTAGTDVEVVAALTLCASPSSGDPSPIVSLQCERGTVEFHYTTDELHWEMEGERRVERVGRTDLMENLLDHRSTGQPLLAPVSETGAFMAVLQACQVSPPPTPIAGEAVQWWGSGQNRSPVVRDVEELIGRMARTGRSWSQSGAAWATSEPHRWVPPASVGT